MTDAILVLNGVVEGVVRDTADPLAFGSSPNGVVFIVPSSPPVCGGQLWDGTTATDPPPPDPGPPPRRLIRKSVVQARTEDIGKWTAVVALLFTNGLPNVYFGRWFTPDWPSVYADDADMLMMLSDAGCTADQIAVITAP